MKRTATEAGLNHSYNNHSLIEKIEYYDKNGALEAIDSDRNLDTYSKTLLQQVVSCYFRDVKTSIHSIPNELLTHIFTYLDPYRLMVLRKVCWRFYYICRHVALHTTHVKLSPLPWMIKHYPACHRFNFVVNHIMQLTDRFFDSLSSSHASECCITVNDSTDRLDRQPLHKIVLQNITQLELRKSLLSCPCYFLRGNKTSIHEHFPNLVNLLLEHLATPSHTPRCKLLTFVKRNLYKLEGLQLGNILHHSWNDYSHIMQRIFNVNNLYASMLRVLKLHMVVGNSIHLNTFSIISEHMPQLSRLEIVINRSQLLFERSFSGMLQCSELMKKLQCMNQLKILVTYIELLSIYEWIYDNDITSVDTSLEQFNSFVQRLPDTFCKSWVPIFFIDGGMISTTFYYDSLLPICRRRGIRSAIIE